MSEENAIALSQSELAALIPAGPEALLAPTHKDSNALDRPNLLRVPYVAFRGKKTEKNVESLDAANITVAKDGSGMFYLMDIEPIRVQPHGPAVPLHILQYARFYTLADDDTRPGEPTEASFTNSDELFEAGYRETIYAGVAVVLSPGNYVAATLQLRGAQVGALSDALTLLGDAKRPGPATNDKLWGARSAKHAATLPITVPGGRFRTEIWSTAETPKGGGQKYNQGHGRVYPTPEAEIEPLKAWFHSAWPTIQKVLAVNNARIEKVRRMAARSEQPATAGDPIPF